MIPRFFICRTASLQCVMSISAMSFATWILSTVKGVVGLPSPCELLRRRPSLDLGGLIGRSTNPETGSASLIEYVSIWSPINRGPKMTPRALYPIRPEVGRGRPRSSSRGAVSAERPMRQRRPKTAQISSRRSRDFRVPIAKAIRRARSLLLWVLLNSASPWSWLWMATNASNKLTWPRMPPGSPARSLLSVEATS